MLLSGLLLVLIIVHLETKESEHIFSTNQINNNIHKNIIQMSLNNITKRIIL